MHFWEELLTVGGQETYFLVSIFFGAIWPLHLGALGKLHTERWFALGSSVQHLFGIPVVGLGLGGLRRCGGQLPGGPAGDGGTPVASAICLTTWSGRP